MKIRTTYKGVRDFSPEEFKELQFFIDICRNVVQKYGYEEYTASILEPTKLYLNKTSEEIVNRQMYSFKDRGETSVTLRPEITPTVARMIEDRLAKKMFNPPVRWFSIPNLFRYEQPQKGRKREHWQFNADIFGDNNIYTDIEIINLTLNVLGKLEIPLEKCEVRINDRSEVEKIISNEKINLQQLFRIMDKKGKIDENEWREEIKAISPSALENLTKMKVSERAKQIIDNLNTKAEIKYYPYLARGFDYYTGIIFEIFYKDDAFNRAIAGGGRYDKLIKGDTEVPAFGVGIGDVMIAEIRKSLGKTPPEDHKTRIALLFENKLKDTLLLAEQIRDEGAIVKIIQKQEKTTFGEIAKKEDAFNTSLLIDMDKLKIRNLKTRKEEEYKTVKELLESIKTKI